jgi:hypothetical protein
MDCLIQMYCHIETYMKLSPQITLEQRVVSVSIVLLHYKVRGCLITRALLLEADKTGLHTSYYYSYLYVGTAMMFVTNASATRDRRPIRAKVLLDQSSAPELVRCSASSFHSLSVTRLLYGKFH